MDKPILRMIPKKYTGERTIVFMKLIIESLKDIDFVAPRWGIAVMKF